MFLRFEGKTNEIICHQYEADLAPDKGHTTEMIGYLTSQCNVIKCINS